MQRTMEQRHKTTTKDEVYLNNFGVVAKLQPRTIWLREQPEQAGQTNSNKNAVKKLWMP